MRAGEPGGLSIYRSRLLLPRGFALLNRRLDRRPGVITCGGCPSAGAKLLAWCGGSPRSPFSTCSRQPHCNRRCAAWRESSDHDPPDGSASAGSSAWYQTRGHRRGPDGRARSLLTGLAHGRTLRRRRASAPFRVGSSSRRSAGSLDRAGEAAVGLGEAPATPAAFTLAQSDRLVVLVEIKQYIRRMRSIQLCTRLITCL